VRYGSAVLNRSLEVEGGHVIAEHVLRPILAGDERRAGEGEEQRLGLRRAHVQRQRIVIESKKTSSEKCGYHLAGRIPDRLFLWCISNENCLPPSRCYDSDWHHISFLKT
jgi:hypothetical protein